MIQEWLSIVWQDSFYRFLMIVLSLGVTHASLLVITTFFFTWRQRNIDANQHKLYAHLGRQLPEALRDDEALKRWTREAKNYPRALLRDLLSQYILKTRGPLQHKAAEVYRELGLTRRDLKHMSSQFLYRRVQALRNLLYVLTETESTRVLNLQNDNHTVQLLAIRILARFDNQEGVLRILQAMKLNTRLMDSPILGTFRHFSPAMLEYLLTHIETLKCARTQRALLATAVQVIPQTCLPLIDSLCVHKDIELRIGACEAVGKLPSTYARPRLLECLGDERWEVRNKAAAQLGVHPAHDTVMALTKALQDQSFWVRQRAANSLTLMGPEGLRVLARVESQSDDAYARDAAQQTLEQRVVQPFSHGALT